MSDRHESTNWSYVTWEGSRREQLRRWKRMSVPERFRAMAELSDQGTRLAEAGRSAQRAARGTSEEELAVKEPDAAYGHDERTPGQPVHQIELAGCRTIPLASYLKALAILRLVAEQVDPEARGYWENERFVLESALDSDALQRFFLEEYRPTPVLAPWNGGSGFYPNDNKEGIVPLQNTKAARLQEVRSSIEHIQYVLAAKGYTVRPEGNDKTTLVRELRSVLPEGAVAWLDSAVVLTEQRPKYPPLLGTGGNDGRLDFTNNFMQRLIMVMQPETGAPTAESGNWLIEALTGSIRGSLPSAAIGQFAPGNAGGSNQTTGFESNKALVNPWDFILMLEGAILFASAATRRMEGTGPGSMSYPFTVRATGAGSGATSIRDEANARAEFWAPLWRVPATLDEVKSVLAEGRVTIGRRPAQDGLDFARGVSRLAVARGIDQFQRYAFLMRSGKAYFATPLNRHIVERNPAADIIDELDRGGWLGRFRRHARTDGGHRVISLARRLDDGLFEITTERSDQTPIVQRVLVILGEIQLYLARSPKARESCPPVPSLSSEWFSRADDGTPEIVLGAALAGLNASGPDGKLILPMRRHLAPELARQTGWASGKTHAETWKAHMPLAHNLAAALRRRLIETAIHQWPDKPLVKTIAAPLAAVGDWLAGTIDERWLSRIVPGLMLVRISPKDNRRYDRVAPLSAAYRLLKPFFATNVQLRRCEFLPPERTLPLKVDLIRRLEVNDVAGALELGRRRLRAAGIHQGFRSISSNGVDGPRLLAALLVPIGDKALLSLCNLEFEQLSAVDAEH